MVHLKYSRNIFGINTDDVTLGDGPHVEYFAQVEDEHRVGVDLVALVVVEDDLLRGHDHVLLLPAMPLDVLLVGHAQPAFQSHYSVLGYHRVVAVVLHRRHTRRLRVERRDLCH